MSTFDVFAQMVDYSLMDSLNPDPLATQDGRDHRAREVRSGHFVPVAPTPLPDPQYVLHSSSLFSELGLSEALAQDRSFGAVFSGDLSLVHPPMRPLGWATGYALSIYGTEYSQQCPFRTGNGYGDGRAISVFEGVFSGQRWEMQLKGAGPTPYCRGGDGRAVLRSSVREFLAQELMHALGVPTSRSLTLYVSGSETVLRPWYSQDSYSTDPDILVENPVAIATRVAPSFLRVGQLELFGRRARSQAHPRAMQELRMIVEHLISREYRHEVDPSAEFQVQLIDLAEAFRDRLTSLVVHWIRVGYCQGNFNSDNCAAGGFTLDYGPFGFCELFDPAFQPWTGGGHHFCFLNQPLAAEANYRMFCRALRPLLADDSTAIERLEQLCEGFSGLIQSRLLNMWASKLGLPHVDGEMIQELLQLMLESNVDYTIFFRELSSLPSDFSALRLCFYAELSPQLDQRWRSWYQSWFGLVGCNPERSERMKQVNPKYTWREWLVVPAYQQAAQGDYSLLKELHAVLSHPYDEQSDVVESRYYRLKPQDYFNLGGVSHYSCSS